MPSRTQRRRHASHGPAGNTAAPQTPQAGDPDVALDSFGPEPPPLPEPSTPRAGASAFRLDGVAGEGIRPADPGAEFVSEETLPARPPRKPRDEAALDEFEIEASSLIESSIPDSPPPTVADPAPGPRRDRPPVFPGWPARAAAAGLIAGVTVLGLWWKPGGDPSRAADAGLGAMSAPPQESRALVPEPAAVPPGAESAAVAVETSESQPPTREAEPEAARERPDSRDVSASPLNETDAASPAGVVGDAVNITPATDPDVSAQAGILPVLPQPSPPPGIPAPAPQTPPANLSEFERTDESPALVSAEAPARTSAEAEVVAVLGQYQSAYSRLDAASVQEIWPSVDRERLERAFRNLEWQDLEFTSCRLNITGANAVATCAGVAEYTTRVGNSSARASRSWTFSLKKESESWRIQTVLMR